MPALPTVVSDYLTAVKDALSQGKDLGSNVRGAAQNYLRAQDMASVLDLLQDALDTGALTATGGTARSVQDGAATFVADTQVGNVVVFVGNVTSALAGVEARVVSNSATELFFADGALPAAPGAGDTYSIRGGMFDEFVDALREGKGLADAPAGSVYGEYRDAVGAMLKGLDILGVTLVERSMGSLQTIAGSTTSKIEIDNRGVPLRLDELRGYKVTISGESRRCAQNDESSLTLDAPLSSAPAAATAVALTVPMDDFGGTSAPKLKVHPGAQPGENVVLADLIGQLEAAVVAFTLPT